MVGILPQSARISHVKNAKRLLKIANAKLRVGKNARQHLQLVELESLPVVANMNKKIFSLLGQITSVILAFFAFQSVAQTHLYVSQESTKAPDGSKPFKTVQSAIMSVPSGSRDNPVIIHIAPGTYKELIYIQREKSYFRLIGDDPTNTILSFNLYAGITNAEGKPIGTFKTPSTTIDADDFTAENITFENSAGPIGQALAIRVDG
ncbi:MAG TPA: pectinesterase family protein, partial [Candidatus Polarisedimenticolia bacterium]|nr:pectinesterase family protein [Candidatus Polarisedimenticolia bacterium]